MSTIRRRRRRSLLAAAALVVTATACQVETGPLELAVPTLAPTTAPTVAPVFEATPTPSAVAPTPTPLPAAPTATPVPPTPTAVPTPAATATPTDLPGVTSIPARTPSADVVPEPIAPGLIRVPVADGVTFRLSQTRPILQLPGHTLVYLDADRQAEVDIFTPYTNGTAVRLEGFDAVIAELATNPQYAGLTELDSTSIAGYSTRVFEGSASSEARGFWTSADTVDDEFAGWYPPTQLRMWIIDGPTVPVVVTAESLVAQGQYTDAIRLAAEILSTITLGE